MNNKSIFVLGALLLAVLVSACGGPTTINQAAAPVVRTISVSGSGQAFLVPDIAYIYLGVHTEKLTASEAVTENNTQTQAMIEALTDFGIDAKDIRTTNFSIWPSDKYDPQTGLP
ncbi:MAG: SIMPL domain-containing protein, partial [Anaerolineae bacterium]|nr:SIMPL domain-containing protein [Anaerolineae bacterium]